MKILISGNPDPNALEACYRRGIFSAKEVSGFDEANIAASTFAGRVIRRFAEPYLQMVTNRRLLRCVREYEPDVVWVFKGKKVWPSTIRKIQSMGPLTVNYNADHPFHYCSRGTGNRNILRAAAFYDLHLTYSHQIADEIISRGLHAEMIPFGHSVDDKSYAALADTKEVLSIGFVGTPDARRARYIKELLAHGFVVDVYGDRWNRFLTSHKDLRIHGPVFGADMNCILRKHRVQLNLLRPHNAESHNMRSFEIPSCGGIMLAEDTREHRSFFDDPGSAFFFNTQDELFAKAKYLLDLPMEEAEKIRIRARAATTGCSYEARASAALECIAESIGRKRRRSGTRSTPDSRANLQFSNAESSRLQSCFDDDPSSAGELKSGERMTKLRLVYFQRKRRDGRNFSLEQIFEDVRFRVTSRYDTRVCVAPVVSNGLFRRLWIALAVAFQQGEINHVTGDITFAALFLKRKKTVLTLLDCAILERSRGLRRVLIWCLWFQLPVMRAQIVTVISEATREAVLKHVYCPPERIRVVPVAISEKFLPVERPFNSLKPRILQVGTAPNKNLENVIRSLAGLRCVLSVVGPIDSTIRRLIDEHDVEVESSEGLSQDALIQEYVNCDIVVFASTYEGFGMPILEANTVGRPVVTSNVTSMPEVAGDAACLVDPFDVESIRQGINRIIEDAAYRQELVISGFVNVKRFQPDRIAVQYAEIYHEITSSRVA
ncbi:MAG: glycosyltransferase [Fuerstiella sp.]|nr:glycosyltransferase [Fuerstiella sp.]MCP4858884.1 glycosyltransferase [Fuerstiella sp.]